MSDQYLLFQVQPQDEVETGVPAVDDLVSPVLDEGTEGLVATEALPDKFPLEGGAFLDSHLVVVLGEPGLPLFVDHEKELDHVWYCSYNWINRIGL